jgi:hypothetical protein
LPQDLDDYALEACLFPSADLSGARCAGGRGPHGAAPQCSPVVVPVSPWAQERANRGGKRWMRASD